VRFPVTPASPRDGAASQSSQADARRRRRESPGAATTGRHAARFDFTDTVEFDTTVGSTIELSFNYWTESTAELPLNVAATVDFTAGTTYSLGAVDSSPGARFVAVLPEPTALSLGGFGMGALLALRRRR
jgi:hypothetical protein